MDNNFENFVFYGSWRETLEGYREEFGNSYANELLWNIMTMGTAGDIETDKKSIISCINGMIMPNISAAKNRYEASVRNGRKGGRPVIELNKEEVMAKKLELRTWKKVAEYYGISEQTLKTKRDEWEKESENVKNPKNLDKDIDKYIDKDKENEKEKDKDNEIYKDNDKEKDIDIEKEKEKDTNLYSALRNTDSSLASLNQNPTVQDFFGLCEAQIDSLRYTLENFADCYSDAVIADKKGVPVAAVAAMREQLNK